MAFVPIYAALLAIFFVGLSIRAIRLRKSLRIAVGDGGNVRMLRAMRVHSNFAEYVPLALVLLFMVEISGAAVWLVHGLGGLLLIGRMSHAFGVSQEKERFQFRIAGMMMTFACLMASSIYLIVVYGFFPMAPEAALPMSVPAPAGM